MPTYEYRCDHCATNFDVVQSFQDDPLTECPTCGSPVRKVFGSVGIVFKGSGFYKTDSRPGNGSSSRPGESTAAAAAGDAAPGGSGPTTESSTSDSSTSDSSDSSDSKGGVSPDKNTSGGTPSDKAAPSTKVPSGSTSSSGGSGSGSSTAPA